MAPDGPDRPSESGDTGRLLLRYRLMPTGIAPRPIALEVPGWGGEKIPARDGAMPQPWHCQPFLEGSLYGLELLYPYQSECRIVGHDNGIEVVGDFSENVPGLVWPPFRVANPGHYSVGSLIDLQVPPSYAVRIEPHPRFFTDTTGTVPIPVIGNLQTHWWPMFFFVTFKAPHPGHIHIFRPGEPYAQVIVVPSCSSYELVPMEGTEAEAREVQAQLLMRHREALVKRRWHSTDRLPFDDLYKQLQRINRGPNDG